MIPTNLSRINDEVFLVQSSIAGIKQQHIEFIKQQADSSCRKRARICVHPDSNSRLHEMIIVLLQQSYVRPHKHLDKPESFHIIEGEVDVILFNDKGALTDLITLSTFASSYSFFYRLDQPIFHSLIIRSPYLVVHEVTEGPFLFEKTEYAPWAPEEQSKTAVADYRQHLEHLASIFKSAYGK